MIYDGSVVEILNLCGWREPDKLEEKLCCVNDLISYIRHKMLDIKGGTCENRCYFQIPIPGYRHSIAVSGSDAACAQAKSLTFYVRTIFARPAGARPRPGKRGVQSVISTDQGFAAPKSRPRRMEAGRSYSQRTRTGCALPGQSRNGTQGNR